MPYVNINFEGLNIHCTTDKAGNFAIKDFPPGEYTMVFSFPGHHTASTTINLEKEKIVYVDVEMRSKDLPNGIITNDSGNENYQVVWKDRQVDPKMLRLEAVGDRGNRKFYLNGIEVCHPPKGKFLCPILPEDQAVKLTAQ